MHICYLDESGTIEITGNTDHFVLLGLAIPAGTWKAKDAQVEAIKSKFGLGETEIHTAWMARDYPEQKYVPDFASLDWATRRKAVLGVRALNLARRGRAREKDLLKGYIKTEPYVHLERAERVQCLTELATLVGSWTDARLFADAQSKQHAPNKTNFEFAFEQVVTRFHTYLVNSGDSLGILVQDNNETVAKRLTAAMRRYHRRGTAFFANIQRIVETPLFVDSELTSIVQMSDLCAYATRRFFDRNERDLFELIRPRFDRKNGYLVGLRHYTAKHQCRCEVCVEHGRV